MKPEQREELKQAAMKATPGPWIAGDDEDSDYFLIGPESYPDLVTHPVVKLHAEYDALYLAAANPTSILSLIAQVEALTVPQWISVEDRLPEPGMCIAFSNWGIRPAHRHDPQWAGGCFQDVMESADEGMYGSGPGPYKVTHWMPLPAAPTIPAIPGTKEGAT